METRIVFTKAALTNLPVPAAGQRFTFHDTKQPGLQLRVTPNNVKTFAVFKRVAGGSPERVSIGRFPEVTVEQARAKAREVVNALATGVSLSAGKRQAKAKAAAVPTLGDAVREYVERARRADGKPLKPSTRHDYLKMVEPGVTKRTGRKCKDGMLLKLAEIRIDQITADDIHRVYDAAAAHGERQQTYAMQVLRAVLNFYGVAVPGSPFSKDTPRRNRISLPPAQPADKSIEPEDIGRWWLALSEMEDTPTVRYLKFLALTGCRPSEPLEIKVEKIDAAHRCVVLLDTKTRTDHVLYLSNQAWGIVERQMANKSADERLFKAAYDFYAVAEIREKCGVYFSRKMLRSTFASIAEPLVSTYTLKKMMNHRQAGDITARHYIRKSEQQLRAGWQAVADYLDQQAASAKA
ncbi:tyrosine-type recombinase/integrase [Pseudogulbenkiania ferrooxidans]|uniref:Integrase family protein n=1 Tax=Pseudogulbenkiania ferrooxidans 2002 TaxID=279714 RepID=B9Z851_9NEIS|nr:integrase family protein [Pseudogulbenkiania ferrooxidans]EEG07106.1 integrase family protein [Pseudogulbenkiania ferrooxidans 2002]